MAFTQEDLNNLSTLARIDIAQDEKDKMLQDMQAVLGYISEINTVEGALERGGHEITNIVREDIVTNETGGKAEALLNEAPAKKDGYVKVEQVFTGY